MNFHGTNIALAGSVTPRGVHAYLAANGWTKVGPCHGNTGDVYRLREDECEAVLVPASTTFADYVTRLMQLAETLGRVENRRQSTVLTDLSLAEVDLIRVRLPKTFDDSSIPLSTGVDLLDESRKLLLAAACSASRPQRLFRAGRNQRAADPVRVQQDRRCPHQTIERVARRRPAARGPTLAAHESPQSDVDRRRGLRTAQPDEPGLADGP